MYLRVCQTLYKNGESRTVDYDISKALDRIWHIGLLQDWNVIVFLGDSVFLIKSQKESCHKWLLVYILSYECGCAPDLQSWPEFVLIFHQWPSPTGIGVSQLTIYADDATIHSCFDNNSDHFDKVKMAVEVQTELQPVANWEKRCLVNFNASKNKLISI